MKHEGIMEILGEIRGDGKDKRMIKSLYQNQKLTVLIRDEQTESNEIIQGVRQQYVCHQI